MGGTQRRNKVYQTARARTRTQKPKLLDPTDNTAALSLQLRTLGLYAAATLGDGNCLFRALSDQLYGTPNHHLELRREICDWMEARKYHYEGFVEDDRGFDTHLRCMRTPGTYGGHLELSAFAHLKRRNVKVIQPGLVYVIEWSPLPTEPSPSVPSTSTTIEDASTLNDREKRRTRRDKKKDTPTKSAPMPLPSEADQQQGTIYVAYHDWEHFSSVRSLRGPHAGIPNIIERNPDDDDLSDIEPPPLPPPKNASKKPPPLNKNKPRSKANKTLASAATPVLPEASIPLPLSRSTSPAPTSTSSNLSASTGLSASSAQSSLAPATPPDGAHAIHLMGRRSPKRRLDDTEDMDSEADGSQDGRRTRRKSDTRAPASQRLAGETMDLETTPAPDPDADFDSNGSLASSAPTSSASSVPPPSATHHRAKVRQLQPLMTMKPLTRRQKKKMGLPTHQPVVATTATTTATVGKIVIPGGRHPTRLKAGLGVDDEGGVKEWEKSGSGRVDVRGFRELRI